MQLNLKDSHSFRSFLRGRAGGEKCAVHANRSRGACSRCELGSSECRDLLHFACQDDEIFPVAAFADGAVTP